MLRCSTLVLLLACGGGSAPPPKKVEPERVATKRIPIEEPEPEGSEPADGVQIVSTKGHMEKATIDAWLQPNSAALSECYTTRVGKRKWLGGRVVIHWDINKAGELTSVKLTETDLGNRAIEKCLLDLARAGTFGKPVNGDADFSIPLDFSAKGSLLSWDEDQALRAVGGQLASLDDCADGIPGPKPEKPKKRPKKPPPPKPAVKVTVPNDVVITMYVGPGGKAQSIGFASMKSEIDDNWAQCAEKTALGWRLTDPRGVIAKLAIRYRAN